MPARPTPSRLSSDCATDSPAKAGGCFGNRSQLARCVACSHIGIVRVSGASHRRQAAPISISARPRRDCEGTGTPRHNHKDPRCLDRRFVSGQIFRITSRAAHYNRGGAHCSNGPPITTAVARPQRAAQTRRAMSARRLRGRLAASLRQGGSSERLACPSTCDAHRAPPSPPP